MKKWFTTFGGGAENYRAAAQRICTQADNTGWFDFITPFTDLNLFGLDNNWTARNSNFIAQSTRGYGYWIWKPFIVHQVMTKMQYGDVLLYADSGCEINFQGERRFHELIDLANENSGVTFSIKEVERRWTKADLLNVFGYSIHDESASYDQVCATLFFLKKTTKTMALVASWQSICEFRNYTLLNDARSDLPNHPDFNEHRHDQSIFSMLVKSVLCESVIPDETYFKHLWDLGRFPRSAPVQQTRNKSGNAWFPLRASH